MRLKNLLLKLLDLHWLSTFILMGLFFLIFGLLSLNLVVIFRSDLALILKYGSSALFDGAAQQLLELMAYGFLSLMFYVLFKTCEKILVEQLATLVKNKSLPKKDIT